jgi:hypothetical protein
MPCEVFEAQDALLVRAALRGAGDLLCPEGWHSNQCPPALREYPSVFLRVKCVRTMRPMG